VPAVQAYRNSLTDWSDKTRINAQKLLRTFLRISYNRPELANTLGAIEESKASRERSKPKPFTEAEVQKMLDVAGEIFPPDKAAKVRTFVRTAVSTGLACRDVVQLERASIEDGWLNVRRQKTGAPVMQKLDPALHAELLATLNGNPRYIFFDGRNAPSATNCWLCDIRLLQKKAGVYIKGDL
jgi:integrase